MAYHPITPGILSGLVYRTTINLEGSEVTINPDYVKNNAGWNGIKQLDLKIIINSGKTLQSSSTGVYALTIINFDTTRQKITLINNGNIFGRGGAGGLRAANAGCQTTNPGKGGDAGAGGSALLLQNGVLLFNAGVIGGGGGGNGGDGATSSVVSFPYSCVLKDCNTCSSDYAKQCTSKECKDLTFNGCPMKSDGKCSGGAKRCIGCKGSYTTTCTGTYTQWCPGNSGGSGVNGSGIAGSNGAVASTGAGLGAIAGYSIVGLGWLLPGSNQGTLNGGTL
jgi:hypothetical protein